METLDITILRILEKLRTYYIGYLMGQLPKHQRPFYPMGVHDILPGRLGLVWMPGNHVRNEHSTDELKRTNHLAGSRDAGMR